MYEWMPSLSAVFFCSLIQIEYMDDSTALHDVRKNKVWGLLHFTENYTASLANRVAKGLDALEGDVTNSAVDTWVDLSSNYSKQ